MFVIDQPIRSPRPGLVLNRRSSLTRDLAGYWPGWHHPGTKTLFDAAGYGLDGVLTAMDPATDWVRTGQRGLPWALDFVRASEYVDIPDITVTAAQGNSFAFWFKSTPGQENHFPLARIGHPSSYVELFNPTYHRWRDKALGTIYYFFPSAPINSLDGDWHWIVGTQDAAFTRLYIDAVEITPAQSTVAGSFTTWEAVGESMDGQLADTAIWHRVLSPDEIWLLYRDPMLMGRMRPLRMPLVEGTIDQACLQFTLPLSRAEFTLPLSRAEFTLALSRAEFTLPEKD